MHFLQTPNKENSSPLFEIKLRTVRWGQVCFGFISIDYFLCQKNNRLQSYNIIYNCKRNKEQNHIKQCF